VSHDARDAAPVGAALAQPAQLQDALVGGRFRIERIIARGAMGVVYLAHPSQGGPPVALKVMTPPSGGPDLSCFEDRFRLEAETLAALEHPNIVRIYEHGPTGDGRHYLALEYVEGPRFSDLIQAGPMDPARVVGLMRQVCAAVGHAHARGVVHRDLKPSNLLVRIEDGVETVKVVDFGLVTVSQAEDCQSREGLVLGSPHCMAPEQVRGDAVDARTDIYAIGVLLFRALAGRWPFHGASSAATMAAQVHQARPRFAERAPDLKLPVALEAVVLRCLARDPADRFPDAGSVSAALAASLGPVSLVGAAPSWESSGLSPADLAALGRAERRRWLVVVLVSALLLAVVLSLGLWRPWPSPPMVRPSLLP